MPRSQHLASAVVESVDPLVTVSLDASGSESPTTAVILTICHGPVAPSLKVNSRLLIATHPEFLSYSQRPTEPIWFIHFH